MKNPKGNIVLLVLAMVVGFGLWWQAKTNLRLREEQSRLKEQSAESNRIKALKMESKPTTVSAEELQKLNEAATEAAVVRERIAELKKTNSQMSATAAVPRPVQERWKNLGQASPRDTLHSVIWAATGGEVDALVSLLAFDAESRAAADNMFASIPPESQALFPSADKLVATIIAGRLPTNLTAAEIVEQTEASSDAILAKIRLQRSHKSNDAVREVNFRFQRTGTDWRVVVPASVIAEFTRSLKGK
ncbi:MAG: hypothetical protein QM715_16185 [Nibricoccus sp.]